MYLFSFTFSFFFFIKITPIGKFVSSVGPGEEINHLLKEFPQRQGGAVASQVSAVPHTANAH